MPPQIEKVKKLMLLKDNPPLAIFDQLERVNTALADLRDAINASKTTEMRINNPEDLRISLDPLQSNFEALDASLRDIKDILAADKEPTNELAKVEQLLQQLVNEEMKPEKKDPMMEKHTKLLDDLLYAVQTLASKSEEPMEVTLKIV